MSVRVREGIRVVPTFAGYAGLDSFLTRRDITGKNEPLFQSGQRSAGSCCVSIRPRYICSQANRNSVSSPAPVETDRRPENEFLMASFAVATAPALLREGPIPTAYQDAAEGEPIMAQAKFREKTRGVYAL